MLACVLLALAASPAQGQSTELSDRAKALDANGNGTLEKDEARGPVAANFETIDKNGDGSLDGAEIRAFFTGGDAAGGAPAGGEGGGVPGLSPQAQALDANGNGTLEKDEARGPVAANFDKIDTDGNGALDGAELRAFFTGGGGGSGGPPPATVVVDTVIEESVGQTTPIIGRFVARQAGAVAARISGPVLDMSVDVGDRVAEGAVIARLDQERLSLERDRYAAVVSQQSANLAAERANLEKRRNELKRLERIRKSAAFSQARYDDLVQDVATQTGQVAETRAQLVQAETQLQQAERDLADAEIRAPFAGVVSETHTEVGAYLSVGSPVVTIINDTNLDIEADVPTSRLSGLTPGTPVTVRLDNGETKQATVRAIVPNENPRTRTRPVRLTPVVTGPKSGFADNQSVTVLVPVGSSGTAVTVSKDAIIERGGAMSVFTVRNGVAVPTPVVVGQGVGSRFVVTDGLKPGDQVVVRGNEGLRPGQRLDIVTLGSAPANGRGGG
ncbi:MAG: efflux RND transporter periplasmic adaptor subunit [Alphaproteobacteria bacterium]|nr:efflux RND transporter periplasmic adaptor subunit [Alphaproteobacteria bacterium]